MSDPKKRDNVKIGNKALVRTEQGTKITGIIKEILGYNRYHFNGIKVRLGNDIVGRVIELYPTDTEENTVNKWKEELLKNQQLNESETLEFKASLHFDYDRFKYDSTVEKYKMGPLRIARTIAAFANAKGGTLYIGLDDNTHEIIGLCYDYELLDKKQNADGFLSELDKCLKNYLGHDIYMNCNIVHRVLDTDQGSVCAVRISPSNIPIVVTNDEKQHELYVRENDNSSRYDDTARFCDYWCKHSCELGN